jgi:hypothetical protein
MEKRLYSYEDKLFMLERQDYLCGGGCGTDLWKEPLGKGQGHHILPHAMGGAATIENGVILCQACHTYHDNLAICGQMYGGDYDIWDMDESQMRDPYLVIKSIPLALNNRENPAIQRHIEKSRRKIYGTHGTIYERTK